MSSCLNISKEELKPYADLNISLYEVTRDYMENGTLRSPRAIRYKLDQLTKSEDKWYEHSSQQDNMVDRAKEHDSATAQEWLYQFSKAVSVESKVVSEQDAKDIHASKNKVYNGESAFFADDIVYFIEGKLTPESVVHEFSHPIIKSLPKNVRDKMYDELLQMDFFKDIVLDVRNLYKGVKSDAIQEEVLVRALTRLVETESLEPKLKTWFDKLLYTIRQSLRKLLGRKTNVGKLTMDTTLKDLAEMVSKGDVLELKKEMIIGTDIIEYFKDKQAFIESFNKLSMEPDTADHYMMMSALPKIFEAVGSQKIDILNNEEKLALNGVFSQELESRYFQEIEKLKKENPTLEKEDIIEYFNNKDDGRMDSLKEEMTERMGNLMHSLYKVKDILVEGNKKVDALTDINSSEKLNTLVYFKKHVLNYKEVITNFHEISLREQSSDNPVKKLSDDLSRELASIESKIQKLQKEAVLDIFVELQKPAANRALEKFNAEMNSSKKNASQAIRDAEFKRFYQLTESELKEYKKLKANNSRSPRYKELHERWLTGLEFDRSKAEAMLDGTAQDSHLVGGFIESLSNNPDAAIQSIYHHLQQMNNIYEASAQAWMAGFVDIVMKNKDAGVSFQNRGDSGRKMGTIDVVGVIKDNGEVERIEERTFLTEWKDYRYDQVVLQADINKARDQFHETGSIADKRKWKEAKWELQKWKNDYMNQDFDSGYYAAGELLIKDDIGFKAGELQDEIYDQIKEIADSGDPGKQDIIDNLHAELKELRSTTDVHGVKKTGTDLAIAERLKEYSKVRAGYGLESEIPGAFQDAYDEYSAYVKLKNPGNYEVEMDKWLRKNTRVSLKNSVFEKRKKLIEEKQEILKLLTEENKKIYNDVDPQNLINEQANLVKDTGNQPDGTLSSADSRKSVLDAHKKLEEVNQKLLRYDGLSGKDSDRFSELQKIRKDNGNKWIKASNETEFNKLMSQRIATQERLGLTDDKIQRVKEINKLIKQEIIPTDYYKSHMIRLLDDQASRTSFLEFIEDQGRTFTILEEMYNDDFIDFVNSKQGKELVKTNADFKKFVEDNHYDRTYKGETSMAPTSLWLVNQSPDPYDYKSKRLSRGNGKSEILKIDDQYRIPAREFYTNVVKKQYETEKVVGKTVDNRGKWLPKDESTNRYKNTEYFKLKEENPKVFKYMEELKAAYLKGQETTSNPNDKLYMSFPRTRKTRLENITSGNVGIKKFVRGVSESVYGSEDDIFEYKEGTADELAKDYKAFGSHSLLSADVKMPVIGVFQGSGDKVMHIDDISTDILKTIPEYIASLNHKKSAQEANGYARSMQDVVGKTEIDKRNWVTQQKSKRDQNSNYNQLGNDYKKTQKKSNRSKVIDALIERDFDGIRTKGVGSQNKLIQRGLDSMVKRASKMNFAWNLSSGVINYGQMKITALTHIASGQEISGRNAILGEAWGMKTASFVSRDLRKRKHKSLEEQLFTIFDAVPGRALDTMGDTLSRTYAGDVLDGKLTQNVRHWLELQGSLQNFGGMMYQKKVKITDSNGHTTEIPYIKAFELVDGIIQTKEGVDKEYQLKYDTEGNPIIGAGFTNQKMHMQNVIMKWNGAFAQKDQALIGRYVLAKQLLFLKKHVIPIASKQYSYGLGMSRNGKLPSLRKRMNWSTGEAEWGHAVSTLALLHDMIRVDPRSIMHLSKTQMKGIFYTVFQFMIGMYLLPALWKLFTPTWGDDDDKMNTNAMKDRSGWYDGGLFGKDGLGVVRDQDSYTFNREENGFLLNHLSMITAKLSDEYSSVNWLASPSGWADLFSQTTSQSIAMTQSLGILGDMLNMVTGRAEWDPKTDGGPYFFQEKGYEYGNILKLIAKFHGLNGKMLDPVGAQQKFDSGQRIAGKK